MIETESSASLEDLLAFVDAYEVDQTAIVPAPERAQPVAVRKTRSRVGHELNRLHREAKYLEMLLKRLHSSSKRGNETTTVIRTEAGRAKWTEAVLNEYRRYWQSMHTNQQLKVLVAMQHQVTQAPQGRLPACSVL